MLEKALESRNVNFVSHDFCQQLLREVMVTSEVENYHCGRVRIGWNSCRDIGKLIYFIACFSLLPGLVSIKTIRDLLRESAKIFLYLKNRLQKAFPLLPTESLSESLTGQELIGKY